MMNFDLVARGGEETVTIRQGGQTMIKTKASGRLAAAAQR
jgi:hypothetical protein